MASLMDDDGELQFLAMRRLGPSAATNQRFFLPTTVDRPRILLSTHFMDEVQHLGTRI